VWVSGLRGGQKVSFSKKKNKKGDTTGDRAQLQGWHGSYSFHTTVTSHALCQKVCSSGFVYQSCFSECPAPHGVLLLLPLQVLLQVGQLAAPLSKQQQAASRAAMQLAMTTTPTASYP
jgi:hypothetical protein